MRGRPKRLPSSAGAGLLAALAGMAQPATFIGGGRASSYRARPKKNPHGHKLAKRIKRMCGGR
jgi:hypothetical protein